MGVYALALTANGAHVCIEIKKCGGPMGSSAEAEGLGLLKLSDKAVYGRICAQRFGIPTDGPTRLLCDAEAALRVSAGQPSSARLKHVLQRSAIVARRYADGLVGLAHIPDAANFVDFLTKWGAKG